MSDHSTINHTGIPGVSGTPAFVGARAVETTAQSLVNDTAAVITFNDADTFDTDAFHDTATNTGRQTVPAGKGGKYLIGAELAFAFNATGFREIQIRLNGVTVFHRQRVPPVPTTGNVSEFGTSTLYALAAGDYVEVLGFQNSGGALNCTGVNFWIALLGS